MDGWIYAGWIMKASPGKKKVEKKEIYEHSSPGTIKQIVLSCLKYLNCTGIKVY